MSIYISNSLYLSGTTEYDANNPIVGYHSVLTPDDITVPETTSLRPAFNAWTPDTALVWEGEAYSGVSATLIQYIELANTNNVLVDYIGIGRHNFGDNGYEYTIQYSDDGGAVWLDASVPRIVGTNDSIMHYFDARTSGLFRIKIEKTGTDIAAPIIGHIKLGVALVLQRRIYVGHAPATLAKNVKRSVYGSENGQYLGQIIQRSYYKSEIKQENNTPDFVRTKIVPFINHVNGQVVVNNTAPATFFFAWRPSDYPDEVIYGWTSDNIQPQNQGGDRLGGRMSWDCSIEAVV